MSRRRLLRFPATRDGFADAFLELRRTLGECRIGTGTQYRCELVFEEIVTNIIRHAFSGTGDHTITVALEVVGSEVVLEFEDDGKAFDPRCAPEPEPIAAATAAAGGRGLPLVRSAVRALEYQRTPGGRNRLVATIVGD
jgi:anti-sigma regulatory factor (Ser/Thr protein kinase)